MGISFLFKYTSFIQFYFVYTPNSYMRTNTDLLLTIQHKNTIERTMKVTFNEKEYELKYSFMQAY